jgi:hypothetical protein
LYFAAFVFCGVRPYKSMELAELVAMTITKGKTFLFTLALSTIISFCFLSQVANAEEPTESDIQELIRGDAQFLSSGSWASPYRALCKTRDGKQIEQSQSQQTNWVVSLCKLYELLARGEFQVRTAGCVKALNDLGYNCDFTIQSKSAEGEDAAIVSEFFNPRAIHTSRFVYFDSKWYLAEKTSPFLAMGLMKPR